MSNNTQHSYTTTPLTNPSSQGSVTNTNVNIPVIESYQPTVRVMRLYKPGFHLIQNLPNLPMIHNDESNLDLTNEIDYDNSMGTDLTLSSYLLLPDSFGDIYCGEKFSAYVAIVNGFPQIPFYNVTLSIRLQTTTAVIDLSDIRQLTNNNLNNTPITSRTLSFNDNFDMIVEQKLTELGIHTLRVSVSYYLTANSNEAKTLRKFYRFNVLQPLILQSSYIEINNKPMIQCDVTNATKSIIFIDQVSFIPTYSDILFEPISYHNSNNNNKTNTSLMLDNLNNELILLQTGETYSFAFKYIEKADDAMIMLDNMKRDSIGYPLVKWCACMGEFSNFAGEYTIVKLQKPNLTTTTTTTTTKAINDLNLNLTNTNINKQLIQSSIVNENIKFECISKPKNHIYVGNEFAITIRCYNYSDKLISMQLDTKSINSNLNKSDYIHGLCFIGLTNCNIGVIDVTDYVDIDIILYAISPGLYDIPNICFIDKLSKTHEKYYMKSYCTIRIYDNIESDVNSSM